MSSSIDLNLRRPERPGLDRERIAEILHTRHRVIAERALLTLPATVRQLVEDEIPVLAQMAASEGGEKGRASREELALMRFFDSNDVDSESL